MVAELVPTSLVPEEPDSPWSPQVLRHTQKADRLFDAGMLDETLREYQAALKVAPDDAYLHNNLGTILARLSRGDEALTAFSRAVELNGENPIMLRNKAYAFWEMGQLPEAVSTLKQLNHPILKDALRMLLDLHLHSLARRKLISWSGGKPLGRKNPIKLTPGPSVSDYIIEERQRVRGL